MPFALQEGALRKQQSWRDEVQSKQHEQLVARLQERRARVRRRDSAVRAASHREAWPERDEGDSRAVRTRVPSPCEAHYQGD